MNHGITEAKKMYGTLKDLWKRKHISREAKAGMYEGIIEPSPLYGCESWTQEVHERKRMEAVERNCLRNISGFKLIDRVPNVEIRRYGKNVSVSQRIDQGVLRWFGHVKKWEMRGWLKECVKLM